MKNINRPWQALVLIILGSVKLLANVLILLVLLLAQDWLGPWLAQFNPELIVVSAIKPIIFVPLILSSVIIALVVSGLIKGKRWAPIFLTVIHSISLILMGLWIFGDARWAIPFALTLFVLALDIECVFSPFFKKKK